MQDSRRTGYNTDLSTVPHHAKYDLNIFLAIVVKNKITSLHCGSLCAGQREGRVQIYLLFPHHAKCLAIVVKNKNQPLCAVGHCVQDSGRTSYRSVYYSPQRQIWSKHFPGHSGKKWNNLSPLWVTVCRTAGGPGTDLSTVPHHAKYLAIVVKHKN